MSNASSQDSSDMPGTGGETGTEPQPKKSAGFKNVVRLGYVSLFTDLSTEMILGLLPVFIHDQLGASYAIVGLIEGSAEAVNDFFRILTGVITDRIARRKPLVLLGYARIRISIISEGLGFGQPKTLKMSARRFYPAGKQPHSCS